MAADWLIRNRREKEEAASVMLKQLKIQPGWTICDLGVGNGYHAIPMALMAGEDGKVIGVDIQPEMLKMLRDRAEAAGVGKRIIPVRGEIHDPRLEPNSLDLCLMVDVYHEFSHPEHMLAAIRKALKPKGRVVLVEFREEDESVDQKIEHKMSKKQILKELVANGFKLVEGVDKGCLAAHDVFEKER
ncbi:MAG: class I SAM-dependent methyltransferase [Verrucomicrobiales bacterium]